MKRYVYDEKYRIAIPATSVHRIPAYTCSIYMDCYLKYQVVVHTDLSAVQSGRDMAHEVVSRSDWSLNFKRSSDCHHPKFRKGSCIAGSRVIAVAEVLPPIWCKRTICSHTCVIRVWWRLANFDAHFFNVLTRVSVLSSALKYQEGTYFGSLRPSLMAWFLTASSLVRTRSEALSNTGQPYKILDSIMAL